MGFDIFLNFGYRMVSIRIILDKTAYNIQMLFKIFSYFQMVTRTKKIFVGGLSAPSTLDDVKAYFEQFGRVSNLNLYMNKYFISHISSSVFHLFYQLLYFYLPYFMVMDKTYNIHLSNTMLQIDKNFELNR